MGPRACLPQALDVLMSGKACPCKLSRIDALLPG
jgi:hypothetical protein